MNNASRQSAGKYRPLTVFILFIVSSLVYGCSGDGCGTGRSSAHNKPAVGTATTLSWDAPKMTVGGSPLTKLAGYRIYYSSKSGKFRVSNSITLGKDTTTYKLENLHLAAGTYYFTVTSYDTAGNESDFAKEICKVIK